MSSCGYDPTLGQATRSIIMTRMATALCHLGQNKAQTGFKGGQETRALDEEFAITSTPGSVRLLSSLRIDWVDGIEIVCLLRNEKKQKARPKGVNLKVRWRAKVAMR